MGLVTFSVLALIGYFFALGEVAAAETIMQQIFGGLVAVVATLFLVCAELEQLNKTTQKRRHDIGPETTLRIEELAADVAWFKVQRAKEIERENEARLSRAQR